MAYPRLLFPEMNRTGVPCSLQFQEETRVIGNLTKSEGLLVNRRTSQTSPNADDELVVVEPTTTKETTLLRNSGVLAGRGSVEPAEAFHQIDATTLEVPPRPGKIRWWDLCVIALYAYLGWTISRFLIALVGGFL